MNEVLGTLLNKEEEVGMFNGPSFRGAERSSVERETPMLLNFTCALRAGSAAANTASAHMHCSFLDLIEVLTTKF